MSILKKLFNKKPSYNFSEPENTVCLVCSHVLNKERDILFVTHDSDDSTWQFLCGQDDHTDDTAKLISMLQATQIDPSINELFEMPQGVGAERDRIGSKWQAFKL